MSWEGVGKGRGRGKGGVSISCGGGRTGTLSRAGGAKQRFKYGMSFNAVQVLEENLRE